ncbi:MAG: hypothetical protein PUD02_01895 [Eggerthellales bacterium]|nr:hypothetical protein [Eggerthellales bacterium]
MEIVISDQYSVLIAAIVVLFRLVIPVILGIYARKKGYSALLIIVVGVFVSVIVCAAFAFLLPDKRTMAPIQDDDDDPPAK